MHIIINNNKMTNLGTCAKLGYKLLIYYFSYKIKTKCIFILVKLLRIHMVRVFLSKHEVNMRFSIGKTLTVRVGGET